MEIIQNKSRMQYAFGIYGAIFRSVNLNDVLNYANSIEQISKNEKHLLLRNINVFSEFEKHLVYEDF